MEKRILVDDLDGSQGDVKRRIFGLAGRTYEIDLSDENNSNLEEALARYISAARPLSTASANSVTKTVKGSGSRRLASVPTQASGDSDLSDIADADVRAWAQEQGLPVSPQGRVKTQYKQMYRAAKQGGAPEGGDAPALAVVPVTFTSAADPKPAVKRTTSAKAPAQRGGRRAAAK